jgi:carbonic anhydrase
MQSYEKLILGNRAWAQEKLASNPNFFKVQEEGQQPEFLWIGCSDSRVQTSEITSTGPGEVFVHRNIANMVIHTDFNMLSVLEYAVKYLQIKHIIVCGHYGCGGVRNALTHANLGLINKWLRHIKDIYRLYREELDAIEDINAKHNRLVELNVIEQVHNLAETTIVQQAWELRNAPTIHGWVYQLSDGLLNQLTRIDPGTKIEDIYMYDFKHNRLE